MYHAKLKNNAYLNRQHPKFQLFIRLEYRSNELEGKVPHSRSTCRSTMSHSDVWFRAKFDLRFILETLFFSEKNISLTITLCWVLKMFSAVRKPLKHQEQRGKWFTWVNISLKFFLLASEHFRISGQWTRLKLLCLLPPPTLRTNAFFSLCNKRINLTMDELIRKWKNIW